jgi:hypothetical protein
LIAIGLAPLAEALVISGFYRHVRNPMYVGVLAGVAGQVILLRNLTLVAYAVLLALGFHQFVTRYEEPTLRKKYGARYDAFCRNAPAGFHVGRRGKDKTCADLMLPPGLENKSLRSTTCPAFSHNVDNHALNMHNGHRLNLAEDSSE